MPSGEHAVHDGAAEGRHHAKADEHDGRHQLEAETGAARARRNLATPPCSGPESPRSPAAPPWGPRLEHRSSSSGSSPGTPRQLYRILAQNPTAPPRSSSGTPRQLRGVLTSHHGRWRPATLAHKSGCVRTHTSIAIEMAGLCSTQ